MLEKSVEKNIFNDYWKLFINVEMLNISDSVGCQQEYIVNLFLTIINGFSLSLKRQCLEIITL